MMLTLDELSTMRKSDLVEYTLKVQLQVSILETLVTVYKAWLRACGEDV